VPGQIPGDYLTEEEDEQVRKAQSADDRMRVFIRIMDRRLSAITGQPIVNPTDKNARKKAEEEERDWGPIPKAERAELLRHYARAMEEAMAKLEDAYDRNPKSSAIPRALTMLAEATDRHLAILGSLRDQMKDHNEESAFRRAVEQAETANQGAKEGLKAK
jgi:delta 1-pyrroline-5-carboxylate dehydrogenase